ATTLDAASLVASLGKLATFPGGVVAGTVALTPVARSLSALMLASDRWIRHRASSKDQSTTVMRHGEGSHEPPPRRKEAMVRRRTSAACRACLGWAAERREGAPPRLPVLGPRAP